MSLFAEGLEQRLALLGLLNSNVSIAALEAIAPTLNFQSGDIARLPLPKEFNEASASAIVQKLVEVAKVDWDQQELSWNFVRDPVVAAAPSIGGLLQQLLDVVVSHGDDVVESQRRLEEQNNDLFIRAFGMRDELAPLVNVGDVTLLANPLHRYGAERGSDRASARFRCDLRSRLVCRELHVWRATA